MFGDGMRFSMRRYGAEAAHHAHAHHQIVLPLGGVMDMEVDGRHDVVRADRAAVLSAGQAHGFHATPDSAFLVLDVSAGADSGALWAAAGEAPFFAVEDCLRGFCAVVAQDDKILECAGIRVEVAGTMIVEALGRAAGLQPVRIAQPLARAVAFVDTHCGDPLTVSAIARAAGVSESRLHALFETQFGQSPMRYVAARRMARAALLLEETDLSVAEIAFRTGYGDQTAFTRAFRRATGTTPAAHRRAVRRQERSKVR